MSEYEEKIGDIIEAEDRFISVISFSEESIQLDFMDRAQQSPRMALGNTGIILIDSDEKVEAYDRLQDICRMLLRDEFSQRLDERNG